MKVFKCSTQDADRESSPSRVTLETWYVRFDESEKARDASARVAFGVYHKLGMLLRALLAASRALPAYSLLRRTSDTHSRTSYASEALVLLNDLFVTFIRLVYYSVYGSTLQSFD